MFPRKIYIVLKKEEKELWVVEASLLISNRHQWTDTRSCLISCYRPRYHRILGPFQLVCVQRISLLHTYPVTLQKRLLGSLHAQESCIVQVPKHWTTKLFYEDVQGASSYQTDAWSFFLQQGLQPKTLARPFFFSKLSQLFFWLTGCLLHEHQLGQYVLLDVADVELELYKPASSQLGCFFTHKMVSLEHGFQLFPELWQDQCVVLFSKFILDEEKQERRVSSHIPIEQYAACHMYRPDLSPQKLLRCWASAFLNIYHEDLWDLNETLRQTILSLCDLECQYHCMLSSNSNHLLVPTKTSQQLYFPVCFVVETKDAEGKHVLKPTPNIACTHRSLCAHLTGGHGWTCNSTSLQPVTTSLSWAQFLFSLCVTRSNAKIMLPVPALSKGWTPFANHKKHALVDEKYEEEYIYGSTDEKMDAFEYILKKHQQFHEMHQDGLLAVAFPHVSAHPLVSSMSRNEIVWDFLISWFRSEFFS